MAVRVVVVGNPAPGHVAALGSVGASLVGRMDTEALGAWSDLPLVTIGDIAAGADVVLVAGPLSSHSRRIAALCRAGVKAMLVEAPFCSNAREVEAVAAFAARFGAAIGMVSAAAHDPAWRMHRATLAARAPRDVRVVLRGRSAGDIGPIDPGVVLSATGIAAPPSVTVGYSWLVSRTTNAVAHVRAAFGDAVVRSASQNGDGLELQIVAGDTAVRIQHRPDDADDSVEFHDAEGPVELRERLEEEACARAWATFLRALDDDGSDAGIREAGAVHRLIEAALGAMYGTRRPDPEPRIVQLGAGYITQIHLPVAAALGRVVRVASRTPESAETRAFPLGAQAATFDDDGLYDGADAVIVAGIPATHAEHCLSALGAGCAVLVEKPLARTVGEARLLADAARAPGAHVVYGENLAFMPVMRRAIALAAERRPAVVRVTGLWPTPGWGNFQDPAYGGGVTFDAGPHAIDLARMLLGRPAAESVFAELRAGDNGVDVGARLVIRFAGERTAEVELAWTADEMRFDAEAEGLRVEIAPTLGLQVDGVSDPIEPTPGLAGGLADAGYVGQVEALLGTGPVLSGADDGLAVLEIIAAAYRSARTGEVEWLPFAGPLDRSPLELWHGP